jgi:hypothetical protein
VAKRAPDFESTLDALRPKGPAVGSRDTYLADSTVMRLLQISYKRKQKDRNWTWPKLIEVMNNHLRELGKQEIESSCSTVAAFCKRRFGNGRLEI